MSSVPQSSRRLCGVALLFLLMAGAALSIDLDTARRWKQFPQKGVAYSAAVLSEGFGHALGVGWVLLAIAVLDPLNRGKLASLAALAFGSGLLSNVVKLIVPRWRPSYFRGGVSVWDTFLASPSADFCGPVAQSLGMPTQSFPSSHTATAVGLAIGLITVYPQGRWLFIAGATLAGLQRQAMRAHFTSDVLVGAAIGCLWCAVWLHPRLLGRKLQGSMNESSPPLSE